MQKIERLKTAFNLQLPDRPPILGGWLAAPEHIQAITGCSDDDYWSDPLTWGLQAEKVLGSDGLIEVFEPVRRGEFRFIDHEHYAKHSNYTIESVLAEIEALTDPDEIEACFDQDQAYTDYVRGFRSMQARCGDMLWCPADWELLPRAMSYYEFGYESSLMAMALYPERYRKWIRVNAAKSHQMAILYARAIREGNHPGVILTGEDICGQRGPFVSPKFLREEQFPYIEYALEPLFAVGAKILLHIDGDWRPILTDMLALGFAGMQGFQPECGMDLEWIAKLRTSRGDPLLIFGPMPVTTTLRDTPEMIRSEVSRAMRICRDQASLVFFTSNTITPDVPLENIQTFWQAVHESRW